MKSITQIIIVFVFIILFPGCSQKKSIGISTKDISVGIIETRGNIAKSRILFFNEEMNKIGELPLKYATVGCIFYTPLISENKLYIVPQGYAQKKDEKTVLEIALQDLNIKKYTIEQIAMNDIAVNQNYIYTCNNLNGNSYINKCYKKYNKIENIKIPGTYISKLLYANNKLYAFGTADKTEFSYIYIYDNDLILQKKLDLNGYGTIYKAIENNGEIFFTSFVDSEKQPAKVLGKINTADNLIEFIKLSQNYPLDMVIYNSKLFISHFDIVARKGGGLSVYNLETKQQKYYKLNHGAEQMAIKKNKLYILADRKIHVYDAKTIKLIKKVDITQMDSDFSYLSGLFTIEN